MKAREAARAQRLEAAAALVALSGKKPVVSLALAPDGSTQRWCVRVRAEADDSATARTVCRALCDRVRAMERGRVWRPNAASEWEFDWYERPGDGEAVSDVIERLRKKARALRWIRMLVPLSED